MATDTPQDQQPIGDFFKRQQRRRLQSSSIGGADGSSHTETREGCAGTPEPMQLHSLPGDLTGIHPPIADEKVSGLEAGQTPGDGGTSTTCGATAVHSSNDAGKGSEDSDLQQKRSAVGCITEKQSDIGGRLMAISGLEPTNQGFGGTTKEEGHLDGGSADRASGDHHHGLQGQGHCSIPLSEESTRSRASLPLETGRGSEASHATSELQQSCWQQCVAAGGDQDEGTQPKPKQIGGPAGSADEATSEIQKTVMDIEKLGASLQRLTLVNNDTQCYLNASFLTVCWCHLQCRGFDEDQWPMVGASILCMVEGGKQARLELS